MWTRRPIAAIVATSSRTIKRTSLAKCSVPCGKWSMKSNWKWRFIAEWALFKTQRWFLHLLWVPVELLTSILTSSCEVAAGLKRLCYFVLNAASQCGKTLRRHARCFSGLHQRMAALVPPYDQVLAIKEHYQGLSEPSPVILLLFFIHKTRAFDSRQVWNFSQIPPLPSLAAAAASPLLPRDVAANIGKRILKAPCWDSSV